MNKGRPSVLIPSDKEFLSNKKISDRLYVWILLTGEKIDTDIYIDKMPRNGYKSVGINYRTFYRRLNELLENGYLEDNEYKYKVSKVSHFKRLIYEDIVKKLYETKIDNIIKVYVYLSTLYAQYGSKAWFTYNSILEAIGYNHERNVRNQNKVKEILNKLEEMGFLKYSRTYEKGQEYLIKFKILNIKDR